MVSEPEGWSLVRLGVLVNIEHGWPFQGEYFSEELIGGPIVVNIGNFEYTGGFRFDGTRVREYRGSYPKQYELQPGDILLAMTCQTAGGEILGIPGRIPSDCRTYLHNQRLGKIVVTTPDKVDENFLYWVFVWDEFNKNLVSTATGTKILHTAPNRIADFRFWLPSLAEQRAIAHILGALDDKIELNRRMNATLEEMARTLFQSWFVDFDPVRAKAEGRQPAGMDAETAALFPDGFDETMQGDVPLGWRLGTFGETAYQERRGAQPQEIPPGTPYIGLEHMPRQSIALSEWGISDGVASQKFRFRRGEILFGKLRPYFHKVGVAVVEGVCSTDIVVLAPVAQDWFGLALETVSSDSFISFVTSLSDGTRMPRTRWEDMARYELVIPLPVVAARFGQIVSGVTDMIASNILQSLTLSDLRDLLLPRLLSGELRVRDAERQLEAVL
jgi:type I restriction enzyme S subunit